MVVGPCRYLGPDAFSTFANPMKPYVTGAAVEAVLGAYRRYRCATFPKFSEPTEQSPSSYDAKGGQIIGC